MPLKHADRLRVGRTDHPRLVRASGQLTGIVAGIHSIASAGFMLRKAVQPLPTGPDIL
jgi:hypothetical protein